jgi:hypothetical protein
MIQGSHWQDTEQGRSAQGSAGNATDRPVAAASDNERMLLHYRAFRHSHEFIPLFATQTSALRALGKHLNELF